MVSFKACLETLIFFCLLLLGDYFSWMKEFWDKIEELLAIFVCMSRGEEVNLLFPKTIFFLASWL